jgi:hypothetical protein
MLNLIAVALLTVPQIPKEPAKDLFVHQLHVPGLEVRFVDYHFQPAVFESFEKGGELPAGNTNWIIARLIVENRALHVGDKLIGVGNYALAVWPRGKDHPTTLEIREVDMRLLVPSINVLSPLPQEGETAYRGTAVFEPAGTNNPRMDATLVDGDGKATLTILWGDRRLVVPFVR